MICDRVQELLASYTENDLSPEDRVLVERHCASCPECAGLLAALKRADAALASFPELEPGAALLVKLARIPETRQRRPAVLAFFLKPSLQPVFAAATVFLTLVSLYMFNPNKKAFDKALSREFHRGVSRIGRLYAKAGAVTDTLGEYADNVFATLKTINPLGKSEAARPVDR